MSANATTQLPYKPLADAPGTVEIEKQLEWYRLIHLGRLLDEKARNYLRQAKGWSYHASHAGHDGIQLAMGLAFRPNKDFMFPYYRDMLTCPRGGSDALRDHPERAVEGRRRGIGRPPHE